MYGTYENDTVDDAVMMYDGVVMSMLGSVHSVCVVMCYCMYILW